MATINSSYSFDLEDRITWDELAPSLQDKFKELWNKIYATNGYLDDRTNNIRITIGTAPPNKPIEYMEYWFDTRYMVTRAYVDGKWELTRAAWYGKNHNTVVSTPEAPLSKNPATVCHCHTITWPNEGYCHCKTQLWDPSTVPEGMVSDISFNQKTDSSASSKQYQLIINAKMDAVVIQTLNCYTDEVPNSNAILPSYTTTRVSNEIGEQVEYCTFDSKYDAMFDENANTSYVFNTGTVTIPITFGNNIKLTGLFGSLANYSNGPVTITLQVYTANQWKTIKTITLKGNPQYASHCHGNCHCARW